MKNIYTVDVKLDTRNGETVRVSIAAFETEALAEDCLVKWRLLRPKISELDKFFTYGEGAVFQQPIFSSPVEVSFDDKLNITAKEIL